MKNIIRTTVLALAFGGLMLGTSCTDAFLDEQKVDQASSDYLNEPEGLASLANSLYQEFNYFFSNESSYCYTNYGTDEFMVAGDNSNQMWNDYDARLGSVVTPAVNSNTQAIDTYWNTLYEWIGRCNTILSKASVVEGTAFENETLGLAYFVRGFNHLFLTMQFGDIPLVTEAYSTPQREFSRAPQKDVYERIILDLEEAYKRLTSDASQAKNNYVTKWAAAHYLAQAHLWRASEINDSWNAEYKTADLEAVIKYADEVIAAHPLVSEYNDLFNNFTAYDTSITETNTEIVLSSGSSGAEVNNRKSNWGLALFTAWYQGFPLMKRDVAGAREYQRMKTTPSYAYYLYDLENDSRFWKSFKTTYAVNNATEATITVDGQTIPGNEYFPSNNGEYLSTMYIINREDYGQKYYRSEVNIDKTVTAPSYTRTDYRTGKKIPAINALIIYEDNSDLIVGTSMTPDYNTLLAPLCKYLDGAVNANNLGSGYRDGLLARSAEDYFFKAEALIRQGNIDAGLAVLQPLRDRAEFKAGEERDAYMDGGMAYHYNTYKSGLSGFEANCAFYPMNIQGSYERPGFGTPRRHLRQLSRRGPGHNGQARLQLRLRQGDVLPAQREITRDVRRVQALDGSRQNQDPRKTSRVQRPGLQYEADRHYRTHGRSERCRIRNQQHRRKLQPGQALLQADPSDLPGQHHRQRLASHGRPKGSDAEPGILIIFHLFLRETPATGPPAFCRFQRRGGTGYE